MDKQKAMKIIEAIIDEDDNSEMDAWQSLKLPLNTSDNSGYVKCRSHNQMCQSHVHKCVSEKKCPHMQWHIT